MDGALTPTPVVVNARQVDAGRGLAWWTEAWALFTRNPGMWILMALVLLVGFVVLSLIPLLGGLAVALLAPVLVGGWLQAARKVEGGGTLEFNDLFSCFSTHLSPLVVVGALLVVAMVILGVIMGALGAGAFFGMVAGGMHNSMGGVAAGFGVGMLAMLICVLVGFVVGMALWFAPALVVFHGAAPLDAIKASFAGSLKNIVPFLVFSVLYLVAAVVASIPFGLGWIVLAPVLMLSSYTSARDIYPG